MGIAVCPYCHRGMCVRVALVPYLVHCPACDEALLCAGLSSRGEIVLFKLGLARAA